jgi:hypothetical protein
MKTKPRIAGPSPLPPFDRTLTVGGVPCPDPKTHIEIASAPSPAVVDASQLDPGLVRPPNAEPNFGGTTHDKVFRHTFKFKMPEGKCCQCMDATLTINLKTLQQGTSHQTPDAGNDKWYIYKNGKLCGTPENANFLYDALPIKPGQAVTKTIKVPCGCLAVSGNTAKLTFAVQDDTSVEAATLNVRGCCLTEQGYGM